MGIDITKSDNIEESPKGKKKKKKKKKKRKALFESSSSEVDIGSDNVDKSVSHKKRKILDFDDETKLINTNNNKFRNLDTFSNLFINAINKLLLHKKYIFICK